MRIVRQTQSGLQEERKIFYQRSDWTEGKYADRIVKNGQVIWTGSPYDAATTAYLIATYGAYWQAIRDYGFANPQLVPFINEDNDLIVSLVEVGKERYCVPTGNAYFNTGTTLNGDDIIQVKYRLKNASSSSYPVRIFGTRLKSGSRGYVLTLIWDNTYKVAFSYGSTVSTSNTSTAYNTPNLDYVAKCENGNIDINGTRVYSGSKQTFETPVNNYLGAYNSNGSLNTNMAMIGGFTRNNDQNLVPFKLGTPRTAEQCYPQKACAAGTCGMLDLLTGTFYPNANTSGTFTIELTDTPS